MRLGIVGHAQEKFTKQTEAAARKAISDVIEMFAPDALVSGHSPMGGVDWYAEDAAAAYGLEMLIFEPKVKAWDPPGKYGFRKRNLDIAAHSDVVVVVVVRDLPAGFSGMKFGYGCYHCRDRNPPHVKSGGCWTAWKAPAREWRIINGDDDPKDAA